jgi:DNA mismatch repair protein MutL
VKPAGVPVGASISVSDLFYSVPARRKFLKSETTELGHIASLVTHYALANPDRQFVLKTPTQEILSVSATSAETNAAGIAGLAERVYQLFGRQALEELFEIPPTSAPVRAAMTEPALEESERASVVTISGFASRPQVQRPNRNGIYVFVNRRLVRDRVLLHAISEAYRNILPPSVFPAVLLFVDLPCEEVDVNVHPSKIEVRFRHSQFVHDFTRDAIRQALSNARPIANFPAAFGMETTPAAAAAGAAGGFGLGRGFGSVETFSSGPVTSVPGVPAAVIPAMAAEFNSAAAPAIAPDGNSEGGFELTGAPMRPEAQRLRFDAAEGTSYGAGAGPFLEHEGAHIAEQFRHAAANQGIERAATAESLTDLKPLGQVNASFIVAVNGEGLWIIDQHVAHERILFEQHLKARREGQMTGQRMLMPHIVELSPRQEVIFGQIGEELAANGFEVSQMGPRSVAIQATPAGISAADAEKLLLEILDGVERENQAISMDWLQSRIAATTSCHAAIKINMPLDQTKMEWLLAELAKTEAPMSCPHGRPVVLRYSVREIERAFHRI